METLSPSQPMSRVETSHDIFMQEIANNYSEYARAKQKFFGIIYKKSGVTDDEKNGLPEILKRLLDHSEWFLIITRQLIKDKSERDISRELYKYFIKYEIDSGDEETLEIKLLEFEELISQHVDIFGPERIGLIVPRAPSNVFHP